MDFFVQCMFIFAHVHAYSCSNSHDQLCPRFRSRSCSSLAHRTCHHDVDNDSEVSDKDDEGDKGGLATRDDNHDRDNNHDRDSKDDQKKKRRQDNYANDSKDTFVRSFVQTVHQAVRRREGALWIKTRQAQ